MSEIQVAQVAPNKPCLGINKRFKTTAKTKVMIPLMVLNLALPNAEIMFPKGTLNMIEIQTAAIRYMKISNG